MLGVRRTFSKKDYRWEDKVDEDVKTDRGPYDDPERLGEIQHEDVSANAQLHQGHAIEVEQLTQPSVVEIFFQVVRCHYRIPGMSTCAKSCCHVAACGACYC
jgi:hypothetical protein